jgi:hypothetical protein
MRYSALLIILALAATLLYAQPADTIVIRDSLALGAPPVNSTAVGNLADSAYLASTVAVRYPLGRLLGTMVVADLAQSGAFCAGAIAGGFMSMPFVDTRGEWGGLSVIPYAIVSGAVCDVTAATATIHGMNKKYVNSSPWYATGGLLLHCLAGAGLMYLLRSDQSAQEVVGYTAYLTAPLSGTAAYVLIGKPKREPTPHPPHRP